jgi:hypothetical protein
MAEKVVSFKTKATGQVWEVPVASEAYRRCKAHPSEYEEVSGDGMRRNLQKNPRRLQRKISRSLQQTRKSLRNQADNLFSE